MGVIISASEDFNYGKYKINDNDNTKQMLKEYVKQNELAYIYELLGIELGDLLIADLNANDTPVTERFIKIFDPLFFQSSNVLLRSKGIKEILKGFVFCEFTREQNFKNNINGNSQDIYPSGTTTSANRSGINHKFNDAVKSFKAVQQYCIENSSVYPEFDGVYKGFTSLI